MTFSNFLYSIERNIDLHLSINLNFFNREEKIYETNKIFEYLHFIFKSTLFEEDVPSAFVALQT